MLTSVDVSNYVITADCTDNNKVWNDFLELANQSGLTILRSMHHAFYPQGFSGVVILAESHLAIHTFPENNEAWVEVATCGVGHKTAKFEELLTNAYITRKLINDLSKEERNG